MTNLPAQPLSRTNLLALLSIFALIIICAGFTIGLTFAPCYSSICVERWFPTQTRIHIAVFYGLIGVIALGLASWSRSKLIRDLFDRFLLEKPVPCIRARLSIAGLSLTFFISGLAFASTSYWLPAETKFWTVKGQDAGWTEYMFRVTWAGVTGHWCDIMLGLVFLPVGRNSLLSRAFDVHASSLLLAHKLLACTLCVFGIIHGLLYYSFLGAWVANANTHQILNAFNPDNPFFTWTQIELIGPYGWFVLPTGAIGGLLIIPIILVAALPVIRRNNYNTFYFIHIIFAQLLLLVLCLHASTNFYFVLPGLLLWVYDWTYRLRHALFYSTEVQVEDAGNDWYRMRLPKTLGSGGDDATVEKGICTRDHADVRHPLETYYVRIGAISKMQIHPFTAAATETRSNGPTLLFQKGPAKKKAIKRDREWTWRLSAMVDQLNAPKSVSLQARIEGPYIVSIPPLHAASHVLAIVGGTGITGALSLANWWTAQQQSAHTSQSHLRIVWSVRNIETTQISEVRALQAAFTENKQEAELEIHVSSLLGHMSPAHVLNDYLALHTVNGGRLFVYISGPEGLSTAAENACVQYQRELRTKRKSGKSMQLDWYAATFAL